MVKNINFDKVRKYIYNLKENSFISFHLETKFNLNYVQIKKILVGLEELGEIKYIKSNKIWVKLKNENSCKN